MTGLILVIKSYMGMTRGIIKEANKLYIHAIINCILKFVLIRVNYYINLNMNSWPAPGLIAQH